MMDEWIDDRSIDRQMAMLASELSERAETLMFIFVSY